ncbi:hypothetical protein Y032_0097g2965 [Ancylostoma ceylanicum]|uniref:Uncharacterized protein n=1 Tax=Ancylostoma ceylanicum TaxID=53326 RepID=A0A016TIM6_9BILA|nr:hypothetical protein Y032_0097g2965 [Ancylostoma ceylanicum]
MGSSNSTMTRPPQLDNLIKLDSWLYDFQPEITRRYTVFLDYQKRIEECGGMERFTQGYKEFGLNVQPDNSVICHEWAPGADQLALIGDFSEFQLPPLLTSSIEIVVF